MTALRDPQSAQPLLQQCGWLGASVHRGARHVVALIGLCLEPRPDSFISAPNDFAKLGSIKGQWVKNELAWDPARIKHDQVRPEVCRLVDDAAFECVLVDRNESERAFIPWFNIRKRRRHSKASSHSRSTRSPACNLCGKSLMKPEVHQPRCELFPIGDMAPRAAGTKSMPPEEFAAAETMLREPRVELIRVAKNPHFGADR